jgi:F-type H+-transporting ATPase subunit delta
MSAYRLASRYAKSLLDLAVEKNALEAVFADISYFNSVVKSVSEFRAVLRNPDINSGKKHQIFNQLFGHYHPITKAFLDIVIRKRRSEFLPEFASAFIEMYHTHNHITAVTLTTAVEADTATMEKVKTLLQQRAGLEKIVLETKVAPKIIGGFILKFGDKMIDASIQHKLEIIDDNFLNNDYVKKI